MEDIKTTYKKYIDKLKEINLSFNIQLNQPINQNSTHNILYLNYFRLFDDLINEVISDNNTAGIKINLLYDLLNEKTSTTVLSFISVHKKSSIFSNIDLENFHTKVFNEMLDAYLAFERDIICFNKLKDTMHQNIFLKKITDSNFVLTYPDLLKQIYSNKLELALINICETLANTTQTVETNLILANLLTYLSAALELPDVYVYSKKMLLELSMIDHDYIQASQVITDLEDMNYANSDVKYYKALIRQKQPNNILKYIKHL